MTLLRTLAGLAALLCVAACTPSPPPTPLSSPTAPPAIRVDIQDLLQQEIDAQVANNVASLDSILDPEADPAWVEGVRERIAHAVSPDPVSFEIERLRVEGESALAGVVFTMGRDEAIDPLARVHPTPPRIQNMYFLRYFRRVDPDSWRMTSPRPEPWGQFREYEAGRITIRHLEFNTVDVQHAAGPVSTCADNLVRDLGLSGSSLRGLTLHVVPEDGRLLPFWEQAPAPKTRAPNGVLLEFAPSPGDDLAWRICDGLGHTLFTQALGEDVASEGWNDFAEAFIQWQVMEIRGIPTEEALLEAARESALDNPIPAILLSESSDTIDNPLMAIAFVQFLADNYGRQAAGRAALLSVRGNDPVEMVESGLGETPQQVNSAWRAWVRRR